MELTNGPQLVDFHGREVRFPQRGEEEERYPEDTPLPPVTLSQTASVCVEVNEPSLLWVR